MSGWPLLSVAVSIASITAKTRNEIEGAWRKTHSVASLADATSSVPGVPLTRLFDASRIRTSVSRYVRFASSRWISCRATSRTLRAVRTRRTQIERSFDPDVVRELKASAEDVLTGSAGSSRSEVNEPSSPKMARAAGPYHFRVDLMQRGARRGPH